jgi:uncharacterized membrane protein YvbJ
MPLKPCPSCGTPIADDAPACPKCGHKKNPSCIMIGGTIALGIIIAILLGGHC